MSEQSQKSGKHVEFVSYNGAYPNLCRGELVLIVDGKKYQFCDNLEQKNADIKYYDTFWTSGGTCKCTKTTDIVTTGELIVNIEDLPEELRQYADEISDILNANIKLGCCGGCL